MPFREVFVFRQAGAVDELVRKTGALAAPVVVVGHRFVRGYDPYALLALLAEEGWIQPKKSVTDRPVPPSE
ncbi:hypothetical protein D2Q93_13735 [Alicyclobacillaceae bacterium I2511]|nr:hypothetical protein D2Q93_13735 [Alicyclobacillaceae bacterium I2511]